MEILKFDLQYFADIPVIPVAGTGFGHDGTGNTHYYSDADLAGDLNFAKLLEPGLRKIFFETYMEIPEQFSKVYNVLTSEKARETDWGMGAFRDWTARADQFATVDYQTISPGLEREYIHDSFTQGFIVTREMFDDEQYNQMERMAKAMARSGRTKVEKDAATLLLNGFSADVGGVGVSAIYDAQPLFSAAHPLLDSDSLGTNLATGVLSDANLKLALQVMRETVDEAGTLVQFKGNKLIVPPALEDAAIRLTGSDRIAGGDLNDTNKFLKEYGIEVVVMDFLSDAAGGSDTAWYLQDSTQHEMNFFWRVKPEFKWTEEFDNFTAKYRGYMRYSYGVSDWRGIVGSTGL